MSLSDESAGDAAPSVDAAELRFAAGTLELRGVESAPEGFVWDARTACHRAPAMSYARIVRSFVRDKVAYVDHARAYPEIPGVPRIHREARPYQSEAIQAWLREKGRGVVVLPTGAGKTHVAVLAMAEKKRATLVLAPTLDLVRQWHSLLAATFGEEVGVVGGGEHDVRPITVSTYDSAYLHMEHLGARFGLVVFDECHHLPSPAYALAARQSLAPFRLGLTATPERTDGRDAMLDELVGPCVYRRDIVELAGDYLADYETESVGVELYPDEREEYERERKIYRDFIGMNHIRMNSPRGFAEFVMLSARSPEGRRAMAGYRRQRELAFSARGKLEYTEHLLHEHRRDKILLFTQDNATAYTLGRTFLVPVITHQTKVKERTELLSGLREGRYGVIATSRVLNEGVDVPEANVAIVLSGSGSVREHVQRLGRVLRKGKDKRAVLYELVTQETGETFTSERRREHSAYR
jgi:superfamily II DNA or RNA helicase